jgi:hypothetical protein
MNDIAKFRLVSHRFLLGECYLSCFVKNEFFLFTNILIKLTALLSMTFIYLVSRGEISLADWIILYESLVDNPSHILLNLLCLAVFIRLILSAYYLVRQ